MAFSFRVGTNWCHDFPKLARESGFHFNMHKSRVRVDWNRISFIDIDKVIQDRDFSTIDENVNNVIDYCLESEYNTQILDVNFVKLFRLAQLAVEYLLYCKQYLDHSVVILKDELRAKIEDNTKLKKDTIALEETINRVKEELKEQSKPVETKIVDSCKEIFKCPHCPKTFVSSTFVSAHMTRRHSFIPDLVFASSPIHEQYRAETEKLHSEIKTLKERLNETEKVMRRENENLPEKINTRNSFDKFDTLEERQNKYHEDITHLKNILLNEIQNSRCKDKIENTPETKVKSLIDQQEKEIQRLKDQLVERLTPDIQSMQNKLKVQEDYWQNKIENLEQQHKMDIKNLTSQLKITRDVSNRVKLEYTSKVNDLEKQSLNQSRILMEQGQQLDLMKSEMKESHPPKEDVEDIYRMLGRLCKSPAMGPNNGYSSDSSHSLKKPIEKRSQQKVQKNRILNKDILKENKMSKEKDSAKIRKKLKLQREIFKPKNELNRHHRSMFEQTNQFPAQNSLVHKKSTSMISLERDSKTCNPNKSIKAKKIEDSESETESSHSTSAEYELTPRSSSTEQEDLSSDKNANVTSMKSSKENLQYELDERLKALGIDPEWKDIPQATFLQIEQILKHHTNINSRKIPRYNEMKRKIVEKILPKVFVTNRKIVLDVPKNHAADKKILIQRKNTMPDLKECIESSDQSSISSMEAENDETYTLGNDRINQNSEFITQNYLRSHENLLNSSPRNSKSVLKLSTGSNSSLIKKKVLFALDKENTEESNLKHAKSLGDLFPKHEKKEVNYNWSVFSNSKEKDEILQKTKSMSTDSIVLKTAQSEKIAKISQKIQQQLSLPREKPAGAIETVFKNDDENPNSTSTSFIFENSPASIRKSNVKEQPQPAPRNLKTKTSIVVKEMRKSKPHDSDLDFDIEEILSLE